MPPPPPLPHICRFEYTPQSTEGIPGLPVSVMSDVVTGPDGPRVPPTVLPLLPESSFCMKLQTATLPDTLDPGALSCIWERAATTVHEWRVSGPWVSIGRGLTCRPTADDVNHVLRVTLEGGPGPIVSNSSAVLLDKTIHHTLLDLIAPGQVHGRLRRRGGGGEQRCIGRRERGGGGAPPPPPPPGRPAYRGVGGTSRREFSAVGYFAFRICAKSPARFAGRCAT